MELEELMPELKELESEAPRCALLQGAGSRVEYQHPASPRPVPKVEDEMNGAWSTTDQQ